ncbi:unnamed protein product [Peniophora sp. CBMAI 1063]|nr:unnamed protein product [Peniophora sp. CBMAI 1063]
MQELATDNPLRGVQPQDRTSVLPAESLAHILSYLIRLYPTPLQRAQRSKKLKTSQVRIPDWLSVTHVCQRWRTIALSTPSLWCRIVPNAEKSWDIFIQRSGSAMLSIDGWCQFLLEPDIMSSRITSILGLQNRIQKLDLRGMLQHNLDALMTGFAQPLPHMTSLCIECRPPPRGRSLADFPPNILSTMLPNLSELRLYGIDFPRETHLSSLQFFEYQYAPRGYPTFVMLPHFDISVVVNTLRGMPALRTLWLHLKVLKEAPFPFDPMPFALQHLEDLVLRTGDAQGWRIWSLLQLPSHAEVDIACTRNTGSGAGDLMASAILLHLSTSSPLRALSITVGPKYRDTDYERLTLTLNGPEGICEEAEDRSTLPCQKPSVTINTETPSGTALVKLLLARLPLCSISTLTFDVKFDDQWDLRAIRDAILPAQSLKSLELGKDIDIAEAILVALKTRSVVERLDVGDSAMALFPALARLQYNSANNSTTAVEHAFRVRRAIGPDTTSFRLVHRSDEDWEGSASMLRSLGLDFAAE